MKILSSQIAEYFIQDVWPGRYVYLDGNTPSIAPEADPPELETLREKLQHPFRFERTDVRVLVTYIDQFSPAERAQFNDLVAYQIGIFTSENTQVPDRTLQAIYLEPKLYKAITPLLRKKGKQVLDKKLSEAYKLATKPLKDWKTFDMVAAMDAYRYLRSKDPNSEVLQQFRAQIVQKCSEEFLPKIIEQEALSASEKLLFIDIVHLFDLEKDWSTRDIEKQIKTAFQSAITQIQSAALTQEVSQELYLSIELIHDLTREPSIRALMPHGVSNTLLTLRKELQAIRFQKYLHTQQSKGSFVLFGAQYQALQDLKAETELRKDLKIAEKNPELVQLEKVSQSKQTQYKKLLETCINEVTQKHSEDQEVLEYTQKRDVYAKAREAFLGDGALQNIADPALKDAVQKKITAWKSDIESREHDIDRDRGYIQWFLERQNATIDHAMQAFQDTSGNGYFLQFTQAQNALISNHAFFEKKRKQLKDAETEAQKAHEDVTKSTKQFGAFGEDISFLNEKDQKIQALEQDYHMELRKRVDYARLTAADMEVLQKMPNTACLERETDTPTDKQKLNLRIQTLFTLRDEIQDAVTKILETSDISKKMHTFGSSVEPTRGIIRLESEEDKYRLVVGLESILSNEKIAQQVTQQIGNRENSEETQYLKTLWNDINDNRLDPENPLMAPQSREQIIEGTLQDYRDTIISTLTRRLGTQDSSAIKEALYGWERFHQDISEEGSLSNVSDTSLKQYKESQQQDILTTESAQKTLSDALASCEDGDKCALFRRLMDRAISRYQEGALDDDGNLVFIGTETINRLRYQTSVMTQRITQRIEAFKDQLSDIREEFLDAEQIQNPADRETRIEELQSQLRTLLMKIRIRMEQMRSGDIESLKASFADIVPDENFTEEYFNPAQYALSALVSRCDEHAHENICTGNESFFSELQNDFATLGEVLDFKDGLDIQKDKNNASKILAQNTAGVSALSKLGYFKDEEAARRAFEDIRSRHAIEARNYRRLYGDMAKLVLRDTRKLKENDFKTKYSMSKDDAQKRFVNWQNDIAHVGIDAFEDFDWQRDFVEASENDKLYVLDTKFSIWKDLTEELEKLSDGIKGIETWIESYDEEQKDHVGFWRRIEMDHMSLYDIYSIVKQVLDAREVNRKRHSERTVGRVGMRLFGQHSLLGKEFKRMAEDSEGQRVKEYEGTYAELPIWEIRDRMDASSDQDEVKACVNLLQQKGGFMWDDPILWRALERLQSCVRFDYTADPQRHINDIREKVRKAMSYIWTKETFREWNLNYEDSHKKARDGFAAEFQNYEDNPGGRKDLLAGMLQRWAEGNEEDVDPAQYEAFLSMAFAQGKMNGQPDPRWYFLIMGITTKNRKGQTLLSRDVITRFNGELLATIPFFDFFIDGQSPKKDGRIVPEGAPGSSKRGWTYADYETWAQMLNRGSDGSFHPGKCGALSKNTEDFFYHYICSSLNALDRSSRMTRGSSKNADHDDAEMYSVVWGTQETIDAITKASDATAKLTDDFWRNFMKGFHRRIWHLYDEIARGDEEYGRGAPFWEEHRQKILEQIGSRLIVATTTSQTLLGNIGESSSQQPKTIQNLEEYEKETDYSPSFKKSINLLRGLTEEVLDQQGFKDRYHDALNDWAASREPHKGRREQTDQWKENNKRIREILQDNSESRSPLKNTDAIEAVIKNYYETFDQNGNKR